MKLIKQIVVVERDIRKGQKVKNLSQMTGYSARPPGRVSGPAAQPERKPKSLTC